jgi:hypothetical protein
MSNGTQINVVTNTVEIRNAHNRIDITAPNVGTTVSVTQPTTQVVQINVPGPQGVQGEAGSSADVSGLNTFTGSIQTQVNSLTAATSSYVLMSVTASMLQPYVLNTATSSFITNAQTSSMLQPYVLTSSTSSMLLPYVLNANTSSFVTNAQTASMLLPYVLTSVTASMLEPYVLNASTGSFITSAQTSSMTVLSSSFATTASYISPTFISASAASSGFGSIPIETDPVFTSVSASLATTGSNTFYGNQTIIGNLNVFGTASYTYTSASQLDVGTSWISVNVAEPGERFGGLKVYDSGSLSHKATASLAWDSLNNHWVYQNASGSTYSGGMLISGPRNTGSLGDEPSLTRWFVTRGDGGDHINSTQIFSSGSVHQITGSLTISGSLLIPDNIDSTNRFLFDNTGVKSILWGGRSLNDSNNAASIDWETRTALDINGTTTIDWELQKLYDPSNATSINWKDRLALDSGGNTSIDWENRTLSDNITWDGGTFYPVTDDSVNLGNDLSNRFRYGYFARDVYARTFIGTASLAVSSSVTTIMRGSANPSYIATVPYYEPTATHQQLFVYDGGGYFSSSYGSARLHTPSVVATNGFTGSLLGTATTASYVSPTFISASAAAAGFGSGGGAGTITQIQAGPGIQITNGTGPVVTVEATSAGGTNLGLVYAVSLGYIMP